MFVSQCLDLDIASQGNTEEEALANLREAIELHFEPAAATHPPAVRRIEAAVGAASKMGSFIRTRPKSVAGRFASEQAEKAHPKTDQAERGRFGSACSIGIEFHGNPAGAAGILPLERNRVDAVNEKSRGA